MYKIGDWVTVDDRMQTGYRYRIAAPEGKEFDSRFTPRFSPAEMLELGVFEGKYCNDCIGELPEAWFENARIADRPDPKLNHFGVKSRQPLSEWRRKGWIHGEDPRGWFQWYCRYYMGRRCPDDERQIRRWKAMKRHLAQIKAGCAKRDLDCRRKQRQALLHWAYDSRKI